MTICNICLDDVATAVALPCGHVCCVSDFCRIGGKVGVEALRTKEEIIELYTAETFYFDV